MSKEFSCLLEDEQATVAMGGVLAQSITQGAVIYLYGDLGAGKTTFTRGVVQKFGHKGKVKSPTYTLVEPYELDEQSIYHFDLYRLADPEELEFMGIRDYFNEDSICMIEWPEKGADFLAAADLELTLEYVAQKRKVSIMSKTLKGEEIVDRLSNKDNA
ncbi:tRNA (adenosine(37)-N6)-threonylcarbamoyltransferase complex ATPase subunit type 1 TsaE [Pseudoalteromonas sp. NBT06-2]|uniref:tRNA (adenosine(37)-N6)-threonylcarbamoyltransferase complex ATPase subunit type 1 TsaE n=1 Tax=Pseudoalteromonas sp. NBT06-2 TaxID=2025950 RepID=UPI000BA56AAE|nr:tRNA (adenosine(37)-N6)-threonylcarbamoyltransferase complex ATPase subunit type 1 TsaE [Pseudoalteromonas sp. NBT06-2]PAJ72496.1 tRNA (adenosine(37)-N6)-threonylcarbamoyltransferase complex ATPase subunit type 1 TsaE [Pseudoalteromonas sp. NBT06-2]